MRKPGGSPTGRGGVRKKLDYITDCGVNYLHLMPLLESPAGRSDGGYAVSDFRKVQPELGTMEDLAALAKDCHKRGIAVCCGKNIKRTLALEIAGNKRKQLFVIFND